MWASGARSPLAPTLPCDGTTGVTPRFSRSHKPLGDQRPDAGKALGQHVGADQHHGAHFVASERRPNPAGVRAHHVALELFQILRRHTDVGQQSDAGVHCVNRSLSGGELLHHGARLLHVGDGGGVDPRLFALSGNTPDFIER